SVSPSISLVVRRCSDRTPLTVRCVCLLCVCVCVCMCVVSPLSTPPSLPSLSHKHTHTLYTRGCMQARAHMCTPTELCRDLHTLTYTHIHTKHKATHIHIHPHKHPQTHTHTHTHTYDSVVEA